MRLRRTALWCAALTACAGHVVREAPKVASGDTAEAAARRYQQAAARFDYVAALHAAETWRALAPDAPEAAIAAAETECGLADISERDDEVEPHIDRALEILQPWVDSRAASLPAKLNGALEYTSAEALGLRARQRGAGAALLLKTIYTHAKAAVDLDPNYSDGAPRRLLAMILIKAPGWPQGPGDFDGGLKMLEDYVNAHPRVADGFVHLADGYLDAHRVRDAQAALARARPLIGRNPRSRKLFEQTDERVRLNRGVKNY